MKNYQCVAIVETKQKRGQQSDVGNVSENIKNQSSRTE